MKIDLTKTDVGAFNFEFLRLISSQSVGAAEIGECIDTIARHLPEHAIAHLTACRWRQPLAASCG